MPSLLVKWAKEAAQKLAARLKLAALRETSLREHLMTLAVIRYKKRDRVRPAVSGGRVLWWPALAPLKPAERDIVRRGLGLATRDPVKTRRTERAEGKSEAGAAHGEVVHSA